MMDMATMLPSISYTWEPKPQKLSRKTFELKQAEFQLSRSCKMSEQAEASKEILRLVFLGTMRFNANWIRW